MSRHPWPWLNAQIEAACTSEAEDRLLVLATARAFARLLGCALQFGGSC